MNLISKNRKLEYELRKEIKFPFYTYSDDNYSQFLLAIMQNLEVRYFNAGEMIYHELEECNEALFVV